MASGAQQLRLEDGSRVAVIGGGPAGSLFSFFLIDLAERRGIRIAIEIYEPRNFDVPGPAGCNMCGGILSETLVQNLALEGVSLPDTVIQRGIDSYVLHTFDGQVCIDTPAAEMRIGAVHRGAGPRDMKNARWESLDRYLQSRALERGARVVHTRVASIARTCDGIAVEGKDGGVRAYDLAVVAAGVNTAVLDGLAQVAPGYRKPQLARTLIREYYLGEEAISASLGNAMHVFLVDARQIEFAAIIPKHHYATVCILGESVTDAVADAFLSSDSVRSTMPPAWRPDACSCQCRPKINVCGVRKPYADRIVFIGDSGITRLYKDGIGAAYRTAKAAARTAAFEGISEEAFRRHYLPVCRSIARDNHVGKLTFSLTRVARRSRRLRGGMLRMAVAEQRQPGPLRAMSSVLWDMFSGSATYGSISARMLRPHFLSRFAACALRAGRPVTSAGGEHVDTYEARQDVR